MEESHRKNWVLNSKGRGERRDVSIWETPPPKAMFVFSLVCFFLFETQSLYVVLTVLKCAM